MQLTTHQTFGADPTAVHTLLTDEGFLAQSAVELGAVEHSVSSAPGRTVLDAVVDSPPEARVFLGRHMRLRLETTWADAAADGSRTGSLLITVPGAPFTVRAALRLAPAASGSTLDYDGDLAVDVPFVGPSIERTAAPQILDALDAQERVARRWLAGRA